MCGIYVSLSDQTYCEPTSNLSKLICRRGPDYIGHEKTQIQYVNRSQIYISFTSTVLGLRGEGISQQPFRSEKSGSIFCWNGEAWKIGTDCVEGNDGQIIFEKLIKASSFENNSDATAAVLKLLKSISGPFAFVFFDNFHNQLYYGRDRLGRRSLLYKDENKKAILELCSISDQNDDRWIEVEPDCIYQISMVDETNLTQSEPSDLPNSTNTSTQFQKQKWKYCETSSPYVSSISPSLSLDAKSTQSLYYFLEKSLRLRTSKISIPPGTEGASNTPLAILFSGGLDCTVLARIVHDILPSNQEIDLLNVAFENPRVVQATRRTSVPGKDHHMIFPEDSPFELCPDRKTGRRSLKELKEVCPRRTWRFVAINVPYSEYLAHKQNLIDLIYPHNTEMDLSIASALYFASRGNGLAAVEPIKILKPYVTPARVLLSGLGADELFGGYSRHSLAFRRSGFPGLLYELELDLNRLGKRNLGRDDRVISHWGKEARYPFLDEALVKWAIESPIPEKCGFGISKNFMPTNFEFEPGKLVLRLLSYKLGMISTAMEKKRAIQFGARTAKMETSKVKGSTPLS
ncbi:Asparagine synthetase domain-containing protein C4F6.11c [Golovinomyces cichoracearum]|uniref:Asparagine synthetase domain-containing protein C4F6.11c n=1 Tax=Golovinomyces cichoracearum TaxID=62708 RepID=A0A420IJD2_9PEZI|nr:Asparagine synthetase domain-containing protein C4F6.11c [Golovinomyces cichoracearum]